MSRFIVKRLFWFLLTLWLVVTASFFMTRMVKGGPFDEARRLPPEIERHLRAKYKLDRPLVEQYLSYLGDAVLRFDLGPSMKLQDYSVNQVIKETFPRSALLGFLALLFALAAGIGAGVIAALRRRRFLDGLVMTFSALGLAVPNFVMASLLIILFSFIWTLLPAAGWGTLRHLLLPAFSLGAPFAANIARLTRSGMLEVLNKEFVLFARAKGLSESRVILRHALKGALLPVISYLGPAAAGILTGSLVIERLFAIPGMGDLFVDAVLNRDHTLTMGIIILYAALVYLLNFMVDLLYMAVDPRIRPW